MLLLIDQESLLRDSSLQFCWKLVPLINWYSVVCVFFVLFWFVVVVVAVVVVVLQQVSWLHSSQQVITWVDVDRGPPLGIKLLVSKAVPDECDGALLIMPCWSLRYFTIELDGFPGGWYLWKIFSENKQNVFTWRLVVHFSIYPHLPFMKPQWQMCVSYLLLVETENLLFTTRHKMGILQCVVNRFHKAYVAF